MKRIANIGVSFRDVLVHRFANRRLAEAGDLRAQLAVQLVGDTHFPTDLYRQIPIHGYYNQHRSLHRYCTMNSEYAWCITLDQYGERTGLFPKEIELAWAEYQNWLSSLTEA
jgi:hypothetical protein